MLIDLQTGGGECDECDRHLTQLGVSLSKDVKAKDG